jgi:membrane protease YdiL (CAAX protease family)
MEAIVGRTAISGSNERTGSAPSQRPWRLLLRALSWMVIATAVGFAILLIPAVVDGISSGIAARRGLKPDPPTDMSAFILCSVLALQVTLLWGSLRGARATAAGNLSVGLANRPVSRRELVTLLAALILVWDTAATSALAWIVAHGGRAPALPSQITQMPSNISLAAIHIAFLALAAPLAEELFFRGWLWSALRKSWSPAWTLTWTTGLWLAMHALDGTWRSVILLPTGIILGLARHYGDSVRASLLLHVMNNSIIVLVQLAVLLANSGAG